jgi:lipopolysaccharide heptosyltransferase I
MRVLLLRTSALGDVVHCLPGLLALRRALPGARIGWVVEEAMAPLLEEHPALDELLVVRLRPWRRRWSSPATLSEAAGFVRRLSGFSADFAVDLMGNHKAGILAALSGAQRSLGAPRARRREPSSALWIGETVEPRGVHSVDRALSLLAPLGVDATRPDFGGDLLFRQVPAATGEWLAGRSRPFVLLHPGAAWANKRYPPPAWGESAARLRELRGIDTVVAVAPGEDSLAAAIAASAAGAATAVAAPTLADFAALARQASLVMGGDTGPLHLAHALRAPVLMVMGPTDPARHGPYGAPERALAHRLRCSFCYKRFDEPKACLLDIPPREIAERAATLLVAG